MISRIGNVVRASWSAKTLRRHVEPHVKLVPRTFILQGSMAPNLCQNTVYICGYKLLIVLD